MPSKIPLIFGTMTLGSPGTNGVRTDKLEESQKLIDIFFQHGHTEVDTARVYADGTTEEFLAKLKFPANAVIDSKVAPIKPGEHKPENIRTTWETTLKSLGAKKPRVFYLHFPDRTVPYEETLKGVNDLYKQGKFEIFGLSNYAAWEVAEIVGICKANNYVQPKIYQAMYNAITRDLENELLPCLRKFGLRLVIYNPLAGGFFAGKIPAPDPETAPEGRFGGESAMAKMYRARYFKEGYFKALEPLKDVAAKHNLRLTEIALRWCQHHSVLKPEDGVIIGGSSAEQIEQNCVDSEKGPLPEEVVQELDRAWLTVKPTAPTYWR